MYWMILMNKVLVTGGSGFLGGHIAQECLKRGMSVSVWDIKKPEYYGDIDFRQMDIAQPIRDIFYCDYDYIFHAAGELGSHTTFNRVRSTFEVNINSMLNLMEWVIRGDKKPRIINCGLIRDWLNPYMISKHTASKIGQMYRKEYGANFLDCRMTVVYGSRQGWKEEKIVPSFILNALQNKDLVIYGDGSSLINMMYVKDVVELLVDLISTGSSLPPVPFIDIASPCDDISVLEFADTITILTKSKSEIVYRDMRKGQPGNVGSKYDLSYLKEICPLLKDYFGNAHTNLLNTIKWYEGVL